jgi:endonuclease/exonuclease/phosphatase family metal-dependent hydrolase
MKKKKQRRFGLGSFISVTVLLISAIALLISYVSIFISPSKFWPPLFFGLYYIPIALWNLFLLIIAIIRMKKRLLIPLVALLPSLFFFDMFVKVGNEVPEEEREGICIVTYNVGRYSLSKYGKSKRETTAEIRDYLELCEADIICLQEVSVRYKDSLIELPDYPHIYSHFFNDTGSSFGNVILSKFPIRGGGKLTFKNSTNLAIWADLRIGKNIVRIYNCHLESYSISFTSIVKRLFNKDTFSDEFISLHGHLKESNIKRAEQVDHVVNSISECSLKTIVCGDFNDTPMSYTYHQLQKQHKDCFVEAGKGFGATYSRLWPALRLDYILIPEEYQTTYHKIERVPYSDHYPVLTQIKLDSTNE